MATEQRSLNEILVDIKSEEGTLAAARSVLDEARRQEASAVDRLNKLHQEFDKVLHEMRKAAPNGSDWWRNQHVRPAELPR